MAQWILEKFTITALRTRVAIWQYSKTVSTSGLSSGWYFDRHAAFGGNRDGLQRLNWHGEGFSKIKGNAGRLLGKAMSFAYDRIFTVRPPAPPLLPLPLLTFAMYLLFRQAPAVCDQSTVARPACCCS